MSNDEVDARKVEEFMQLKKSVLFNFLTKEARDRLSNIRTVKPNLAEQVEMFIIRGVQTGELKRAITETEMIALLNNITTDRGFKVLRR